MANYERRSLLSRAGIGVARGYILATEQDRQARAAEQERQFTLQRDESQRAFQTERDRQGFQYDKQLQDERLAASTPTQKPGKTEDEIASMVDNIFPGITPEGRIKILSAWDGASDLYKVGIKLYPSGYPLQPKEYKPDKPELPQVKEPLTGSKLRDEVLQIVTGWQKAINNQNMPLGSVAQPATGAFQPPAGLDPADFEEAATYIAKGFTPEQAVRFIEADIKSTTFADSVGVASRTDAVLNGPRFRQIAEQVVGKKLVAVPQSIHEAYLLGTQEGWSFEDIEKILSVYFGRGIQSFEQEFGGTMNAK